MANAEKISTLRHRRSALIGRMIQIKRHLDTYEANGQENEDYLTSCCKSLGENWAKIIAVQDELDELDEEDPGCGILASEEYHQLDARIANLKRAHTSTKVNLPQRESGSEPEPTSLKLPEIPLTTFSGAIEEWEHFHDVFVANVDRNEKFSAVRKFQYLKAVSSWK
jgi:hypothetical protein